MNTNVNNIDLDIKSKSPHAIHTEACPLEIKEIKKDQIIMSVIQNQVAKVINFPLDIAGIIVSYSFRNVYERTVRKLIRKRAVSDQAMRLLMTWYPQGVIRVGEGAGSDDYHGHHVSLWDLYVVYLDQCGQRMIQFWHWEDWPNCPNARQEGYILMYADDYPLSLVEFWEDRGAQKTKHVKWYGIIPRNLGKTKREMIHNVSV